MQTRLLGILGLAALTITASLAGSTRSETSTYVDGNLAGVSPNTGGTLVVSEDKEISFRTGLSTVAVPYANISHVELGATRQTSHDVPVYKVWALHKRFGGKTETQLLIVNFKNDAGEEKNMTLEVSKTSASGLLSAIQSHTANNPPAEKSAVAAAEPATAQESAESVKTAQADHKTGKQSKKEARLEAQREARELKEAVKDDKSGKPAEWWGDSYWKTNRNADKWNQKAPATPNNNN